MGGRNTSSAERLIPAITWVRRYQRAFLLRDLAAGLAVGAMLIPQGLAFARIVGISPVAGLWSGIAAMIGYAIFGPSRHLMVGPEAGTAMMVAAILTGAGIAGPAQRLGAAALVAMMVAAILLLGAIFRLGAIADFLSRPILVGYINGIAALLIVSQLRGVLGIEGAATDFLPQLAEAASKLGDVHAPTLVLSAGALVFLLAFSRVLPRIPGAVVVVALGILASTLLDLEARGVRVLGEIDSGVPAVGLPSLPSGALGQLFTGALSLALLIYASSALTSRIYADKRRYHFRANSEFLGLAAANALAGLAQGVPVAGSDARTVINDAAGAKTQAAGLFAAVVVVAVIFLLGPVMALLPNALLSAIVIASAVSLFDLRGFLKVWRVRMIEGVLALVTFVGVLVFGILPGVVLAVGLSLADLIRRAAHPHDAVLGWRKGKPGYRDIEYHPESETLPGLIIYRVDAPLFFANARFLREQVLRLVNHAEDPVRMVVLDCGAMFDLDVTAAEALEELDRHFDERGITLALAEPHTPMRRILGRTGLLEKIGEENVFATVGEAIRRYVDRTEGSDLRSAHPS